jgi:signal transduction histidine kinase
MTDVQRELITQQTSEISRNIDHYLSRARAFGTKNILASRSSIREVADDIVYALKQIYLDRNLEFDTSQLMGCWFRGEGQDLEEMLGNLMDNACKWAENQVLVRCEPEQDRLILTVEDDGPGISEENFHEVIRRGVKLDESISGHGQGLGIVNDIAELYDGSLTLGKSKLGGLKAVLNLPIAW